MRPRHSSTAIRGFSLRKLRFIAKYCVCLNATQAAIEAGYSAHSATSQGQRLLSQADIQAEIRRRQQTHLDTIDLSALRVLEEMRRIAFIDPRCIFYSLVDAREGIIPAGRVPGDLKPIWEWPKDHAHALAGIEVVIKNAKAGDGQTDTVHKIKFWDKPKILEMLAKHFELLNEDKTRTPPPIQITWIAAPGQLLAAPEATIEAEVVREPEPVLLVAAKPVSDDTGDT